MKDDVNPNKEKGERKREWNDTFNAGLFDRLETFVIN